jgi:hypothetical protein
LDVEKYRLDPLLHEFLEEAEAETLGFGHDAQVRGRKLFVVA